MGNVSCYLKCTICALSLAWETPNGPPGAAARPMSQVAAPVGAGAPKDLYSPHWTVRAARASRRGTPTQVPEEATKDARELADKELEGIAGGTVPIIKPF